MRFVDQRDPPSGRAGDRGVRRGHRIAAARRLRPRLRVRTPPGPGTSRARRGSPAMRPGRCWGAERGWGQRGMLDASSGSAWFPGGRRDAPSTGCFHTKGVRVTAAGGAAPRGIPGGGGGEGSGAGAGRRSGGLREQGVSGQGRDGEGVRGGADGGGDDVGRSRQGFFDSGSAAVQLVRRRMRMTLKPPTIRSVLDLLYPTELHRSAMRTTIPLRRRTGLLLLAPFPSSGPVHESSDPLGPEPEDEPVVVTGMRPRGGLTSP